MPFMSHPLTSLIFDVEVGGDTLKAILMNVNAKVPCGAAEICIPAMSGRRAWWQQSGKLPYKSG